MGKRKTPKARKNTRRVTQPGKGEHHLPPRPRYGKVPDLDGLESDKSPLQDVSKYAEPVVVGDSTAEIASIHYESIDMSLHSKNNTFVGAGFQPPASPAPITSDQGDGAPALEGEFPPKESDSSNASPPAKQSGAVSFHTNARLIAEVLLNHKALLERLRGGLQGQKKFLKGEKGTHGKNGKDGTNGKDGKPGRDGKDGAEGKQGKPGNDGEHGENGKDGKDGKPGRDGKDGAEGKQGLAGKDGVDGKNSTPDEVAHAILFGTGGELNKLVEAMHRRFATDITFRSAVRGDRGEPGEPGKNGTEGKPGKDGTSPDTFVYVTAGAALGMGITSVIVTLVMFFASR